MKNRLFTTSIKFILLFFLAFSANINSNSTALPLSKATVTDKYYAIPEITSEIPFKAFDLAFRAYMKTRLTNNNILTIIDYTKPSDQERFYVLDIKNNKLLYKTHTAHGKNTGYRYAEKFSNIPESKQSSLGFFITGETYYGKHGYSLRIHGMEKNINHKAFDRAIVIHPADYMSKSFIAQHGRAGRSWGCPALPKTVSKEIINTIKDGSGIFIYAEDNKYMAQTKYMQSI